MKKIELLAPVGKIENAYAAIENGADAIFVGGKQFNARAFADNFTNNELEDIIAYCKLRDVKTNITVNTLVKNEELPAMFDYLGYLQDLGVDALIVQDLGVVNLIKKYFPNLAIHASTQMTAHSLQDVMFLKEQGFERVVLSRELNLKEIKEIKEKSGIEIETFVHGALCYSYSGQCLFSSLIGGRSGNRGKCAQPCRMQYSLYQNENSVIDNLHLLSPKDICSLDFLPDLLESGIDSLKIEGRMKSPEYVASVVKVYRKYLDLAMANPNNYKIEQSDMQELQSIFNRGGFSKGYYFQKSGKDMLTEKTPKNIGLKIGHVVDYNKKSKMATIYTDKALNPGDGLEIWNKHKHTGAGISKHYEAGKNFTVLVADGAEKGSLVYLSKNHTLLKELKKTYEKKTRKVDITAQVVGCIGSPIEYTLTYKDLSVKVYGDTLERATNAPTPKDNVIKQLSKFGSTSFNVQSFECEWDPQAFVVISKLNELRRAATAALEEKILAQGKSLTKVQYTPVIADKIDTQSEYTALVNHMDQLKACLQRDEIKVIYWEWQYNNALAEQAFKLCQEKDKDFYLALPYIMRNASWKKYAKDLEVWKDQAITGILCRTYGQFVYFKDGLKKLHLDYNLNTMNNETMDYWQSLGADRVSVSMELSKQEIKEMSGITERIIYAHLPVMTTEQCILGNYNLCKKTHTGNYEYTIRDRKDSHWQITTDCHACKMQILTEDPILNHPNRDFKSCNLKAYRLNFTKETESETKHILDHLFDQEELQVKVQLGNLLKSIE